MKTPLIFFAIFTACSISSLEVHAGTKPLSQRECIPCSGKLPALKGEALNYWKSLLSEGWDIVDEHHLKKIFFFNDYAEALAFTNLIGSLAEENGHHPNLILSYRTVEVLLWTHKVDGITESDFVMAAKIDLLIANPSN